MSGPVEQVVLPLLPGAHRTGVNLIARCPFPDHEDRSPSFAINIENGLWICHGCKRTGGLVTLLKELGFSGTRIAGIVDPIREELQRYSEREKRLRTHRLKDQFHAPVVLSESILGLFYWKPTGLVQRGFDSKLLRQLDIGYDRDQDRIIFPIRDIYGNLVGVSGRSTDPEVEPRFLVYRSEDFGKVFGEEYKDYEINSHEYLWNAHQVYPRIIASSELLPLIVVEGFKACIWMLQHGYENTVALMGSSMSRTQGALISRMSRGGVILFLDNDGAGLKGTMMVGDRLQKTVGKLEIPTYPLWASQPDDMNEIGLEKTINGRQRYWSWRRAHGQRAHSQISGSRGTSAR